MQEQKTNSEMVRSVGRRKSASARVRLIPGGAGMITVNGKPHREYFGVYALQKAVMDPLVLTGRDKTFDVSVRVAGGGKSGQAIAVRHGIARALIAWDSELRKTLKAEGFLRRDPRVKERKKPGLKRARRAPQWSKR